MLPGAADGGKASSVAIVDKKVLVWAGLVLPEL